MVTLGSILVKQRGSDGEWRSLCVGGCGFVQAEDEVGPRAGMRWLLPQLPIATGIASAILSVMAIDPIFLNYRP